MAGKTPSLGDIIEVKTSSGLGYLQYTHEGSSMGALVRILPGLYKSRPADFKGLASQKELYFTFYTLQHALRNKDVEVVGYQPIPDWAKPYPLMRHGGVRDAAGKLVIPWIVIRADTPLTLEQQQKAPKYRELTRELDKLSIHALWPHPVMVEKLSQGWTPERAEEFRLKAVAEAKASAASPQAGRSATAGEILCHYLYFPQKSKAEKAALWFRSQGLSVEVRPGADGENWLALVKQQPPKSDDEMEKVRDEIESLAAQLGGEYDGWEVKV